MNRDDYDHSRSARKSDYYIQDTPPKEARVLVEQHHYAKGGSNTGCYFHGLYRVADNKLVGVAWWLPPTKAACKAVNSDWKRVVGLSRLVIAPGEPRNAATILLGCSMRLIKRDARFVSLVTYADESQGHKGKIYVATNWQYAGMTRPRRRWIEPATGRQIAPKATVNRTKSEMLALGYEQTPAYPKHKFVFNLL
ncbi:Mom family adenine methylcarbamoylation protein [Hymenobacter glacieicola]|uniref:Uncharacterized protein n=1 Tax=Hymenobacter glacieicola TaxID=1562124 RepID=A0ABQ1X5S0_9BACT|nr:hypothetical protein [Hymenobacter glacieicola]GGG61244.1 hypothetical protein GCM10011378_41570 [Hymenobacter glacieicola]